MCVFYLMVVSVFEVLRWDRGNKGIVGGRWRGMDRGLGRSDGLLIV